MTDTFLLFQTIPGIPEYIFRGNGVSEVVTVHNLVKNASMLLMAVGLIGGFLMDYFGFLSKWNVTLTTFLGRIVKVAILFIGFQAFFALPMLIGVGVAEGIDNYWNVIAYSPRFADGTVPTPNPNPTATPTATPTTTTPGGTITRTNWISWITGLAYSAATGTMVQGFMVLCYILFAIVSLVICALWLTMALILYIIGPLAVVMGLIPNYGEKLFHHYWASLIQCSLWPVWLAICHKLISSAFFDTAIMRNTYGVTTGTSGPMGFTEAGLNDVRMTAYVVVFMLLYGMTPFVINYIFPLSTFGNAVTAAASKIGDVAKFAAGAAIGVATGGTGAAAILGKEAIRGAAFARGLADMTASKAGNMAAQTGANAARNTATNAAGRNASRRADLSAVAGNAQNNSSTNGNMPNFLNDLNNAQAANAAAAGAGEAASGANNASSFENGGRGDLSTGSTSTGATSSTTGSTSNSGSSINSNRSSISNDSSVSNSQATRTGGVQDMTTNDSSTVSTSGNREVVGNSRQVSDSTTGNSQSNQNNQSSTSSSSVSQANNATVASNQSGTVSQQTSVSQGSSVAQQTNSAQQTSVGQQNSVSQQNSVGQQNSVNQTGSVTDTTSASRSSSMSQNNAASQNNAVSSQNSTSQGINTAQSSSVNQSSSLNNAANRSILSSEAVNSQHTTGVSHQSNIASGSNVNAGTMTGGGTGSGLSNPSSGGSQTSFSGGGQPTNLQTEAASQNLTGNESANFNGGSTLMDASQSASTYMPSPSFTAESTGLPFNEPNVSANAPQNPVQTYESFIGDLPLDENIGSSGFSSPVNYEAPINGASNYEAPPSYNQPLEPISSNLQQDNPPPIPMPATENPINEIRVDNNAYTNVYEQPSTAPNYIDLPAINNDSTNGFAETNVPTGSNQTSAGKTVSDEIQQEKMDARDINSIVNNLFND